jgi:hypothetical protein
MTVKSCITLAPVDIMGPWYVLPLSLKNHKVSNNPTSAEAELKICTYLESIDIKKWFTFKNSQGLLDKINHWFQVMNKIHPGWINPIVCLIEYLLMMF